MPLVRSSPGAGWLITGRIVRVELAEDSSDAFEAATKKIRAEMPVNIVLDSVKIDGPGLVIEGRAVSNPDVAAFLRFLEEKIGRPVFPGEQVRIELVVNVDHDCATR